MMSTMTALLKDHHGQTQKFSYEIPLNTKATHSLKDMITSLRKLQEDVNEKLTNMIIKDKLQGNKEMQFDESGDLEGSDEDDDDEDLQQEPVKKKQKQS